LHKRLKKSWQQRPSDFHDGNNKEENCQNVWPGLSYKTTPADDQLHQIFNRTKRVTAMIKSWIAAWLNYFWLQKCSPSVMFLSALSQPFFSLQNLKGVYWPCLPRQGYCV
jgi:hypothetical protein